MHFKRNLGFFIEKMFYQYRSMRLLFFIPIVFMYFIIPSWFYGISAEGGVNGEVINALWSWWYFFYPLCSVWWEFMLLRSYVEERGNELLHIYDRTKLADILCNCVVFICAVWGTVPLYGGAVKGITLEMCKLSVICLMYAGMIYFLTMLFTSIVTSFAPAMLYTILAKQADTLGLEKISYFCLPHSMDKSLPKALLFYGVIGIAAFAAGALCGRYREKYI